MDKTELGKIAARAAVEAEGIEWIETDWDIDCSDYKNLWESGAAAVYRKAIEDAEAALDATDHFVDANKMPKRQLEFLEAFRAKLRGLLDES